MANRDESLSSHSNLYSKAGDHSLATEGSDWLPLLDYAMKTGLSLSTLRRYIKANKVQYKVERGRYLLRDESIATRRQNAPAGASAFDTDSSAPVPGFQKLQSDLQRAKEEIAELKTLIAFYEERMSRGNASRDI